MVNEGDIRCNIGSILCHGAQCFIQKRDLFISEIDLGTSDNFTVRLRFIPPGFRCYLRR